MTQLLNDVSHRCGMSTVAFFSYRRIDDRNCNNLLSEARARLEQRIQLHYGEHAEVFQDNDDIKAGEDWPDRLEQALGEAAVLIPILTPNFFASEHCRTELSKFFQKEDRAGRHLVLPILLADVPGYSTTSSDGLIARAAARQHVDWRRFQSKMKVDDDFYQAIDELAKRLNEELRAQTVKRAPAVSASAAVAEPGPARASPAGEASPEAGDAVDMGIGSLPSSGPTRRPPWAVLAAVGGLAVAATAAYFIVVPPPDPQGVDAGLKEVMPSARPGAVRFDRGTFQMGSTAEQRAQAAELCASMADAPAQACAPRFFDREQPVRTVSLSAFELSKTEVSNQQFAAWLAEQPALEIQRVAAKQGGPAELVLHRGDVRWVFVDKSSGLEQIGDTAALRVRSGWSDRPVVGVTWAAARAYCKAAGGDLPTEAQWERAARGPEGRRFPWGNGPAPECSTVVFARAAGLRCAALGADLADVGKEMGDRTPDGVLHLGGNVGEWVLDAYHDRYASCGGVCQDPVQDSPSAKPGEAQLRVIRGGWRKVLADNVRGAARSKRWADVADEDFGFRCAWPVNPE